MASIAVAIACGAGLLAHHAPAATVEAGPILSSRDEVAILGDSYSAGEGADDYLPGTDTAANPCHRSRHTHLAASLGVHPDRIVACSGAVANDVHFPQQDRTVASQLEQLRDIEARTGVDALVLTLGGNDAGFADIAASCVIRNCSKRIYPDAFRFGGLPSETFVAERLDALPGALRAAYLALNYAVNGPVARAGGEPVPILVLAYPLSTPERMNECPAMYERIGGDELAFLGRLGRRLNDTIAATVAEVREEEGVPIFFVRDTELAFQPEHTLCDARPYVRTLRSFDGAGRETALDRLDLGADPGFWRRLSEDPLGAVAQEVARSGSARGAGTALRELRLGMRELLHPNKAGYAALSQAVLRWSRSEEAVDAVPTLEAAPIAELPPAVALALGPDLGRLSAGTRPALKPGVVYPLTVGDFAPGSRVEIALRSEGRALGYASADGDGVVEAQAAIPPDLASGDHLVVVSGATAAGIAREVEIPFRIDGGGLSRRWVFLLGFGGGALTVVVILLLRRAWARRGRRLT